MKYASIRSSDISNGPGIRASIFVQGCDFHCKNCFNSETWDWNGGKEFTDETMKTLIDICKPDYIKGLSILGGEPLHPKNIDTVTEIARKFKDVYPDKTIWLWTGFTYEAIGFLSVMLYVDVLVDGRYIDELRDYKLEWRGSSNQRVLTKIDRGIIDMQRAAKYGKQIGELK